MSVPGTLERPLCVAIVGSGPSGLYAADAVLKSAGLTARVDVFDRLPTPFGLVRGGVAPDHQKIKAVIAVYEKLLLDPRVRFFGNVKLGRDLTVDDGVLRCTVMGSLDAMVKAAAQYEVTNVRSIETSLEEIFLAYYGAGDGAAGEEASHVAA